VVGFHLDFNMGLEDRQQTIGQISPANLIGRPDVVVEPRAVQLMSQGVREGFITADDIRSRMGKLGQTKEKAALMSLEEGMSPEAQQARMAQTKLAGATAEAALPLVQPTGDLQMSQLEEQQALQEFGPGVQYFKMLAPEAGVSSPITADGKPDYAKRAEIGLQLYQWKSRQLRAQNRLMPAHWEKSPDGSNIFKFNAQGEMITPELEASLTRDAVATFSGIQPGATASAPSVQPAAPVASAQPLTDQQRAMLVEQGGMSPMQATNATPSDLSRLVEPKAAPAQAPVVTPTIDPAKRVPGSAAFLGEKKILPKTNGGAQEDIVMLQGDLDSIANARQIVQSGRNIVGPGAGSAPVRWLTQVGAAFCIREQEYKDQNELVMLINRKVVDASERMKGSLSNQDIKFLKDSVPQTTADEKTWANFLNKWEQMTNQLIQIKAKQAGITVPAGQAPSNSAPSNVAPTAAPVTLSTGRKVVRGADGQFYEVAR
jgi:hypothetical protein